MDEGLRSFTEVKRWADNVKTADYTATQQDEVESVQLLFIKDRAQAQTFQMYTISILLLSCLVK